MLCGDFNKLSSANSIWNSPGIAALTDPGGALVCQFRHAMGMAREPSRLWMAVNLVSSICLRKKEACRWRWWHFRFRANCIDCDIEDMIVLKMNNIILKENLEMCIRKTSSCHLYGSFWKHIPFGHACDLKFYNFDFFLCCLNFSTADDASYEKSESRSICDLNAFPLRRPLDSMAASESEGRRVGDLGRKSLS